MTNYLEDYEKARKGIWKFDLIDHLRFRKRIEQTNLILSPVLTSQHREKIYSKINLSTS